MRTVAFALAFVCAAAGSAAAQTLTLTVNAVTGEAWIENLSGSNVKFDAYEITSVAGNLDPAGWNSFGDQELADAAAALTLIGSNGWGSLAENANLLAEGTLIGLTDAATGYKVPIGTPFASVEMADVAFNLNDSLNRPLGQTTFPGEINIVPEPGAIALAVLGALAACGLAYRREA